MLFGINEETVEWAKGERESFREYVDDSFISARQLWMQSFGEGLCVTSKFASFC